MSGIKCEICIELEGVDPLELVRVAPTLELMGESGKSLARLVRIYLLKRGIVPPKERSPTIVTLRDLTPGKPGQGE